MTSWYDDDASSKCLPINSRTQSVDTHYLFMGFESEARLKKKQTTVTRASPTNQLTKSQHKKKASAFPAHWLTAEERENHSFQPQPSHFRKVVHNPPSDLLTKYKKQQN